MNKKAKVLDISPHSNSWQLMFGTSNCVNKFNMITLGAADFNADITFTDEIENEIKKFLVNE